MFEMGPRASQDLTGPSRGENGCRRGHRRRYRSSRPPHAAAPPKPLASSARRPAAFSSLPRPFELLHTRIDGAYPNKQEGLPLVARWFARGTSRRASRARMRRRFGGRTEGRVRNPGRRLWQQQQQRSPSRPRRVAPWTRRTAEGREGPPSVANGPAYDFPSSLAPAWGLQDPESKTRGRPPRRTGL